ncbi:hypothetical protein K469DRAFT_566858 [Zopfia rhizophila CBS 207.26]|uniref:Uncharacterized protein n=1 Tax=Zopfia rhizophila CBS 207.26 TaxID=1314779 RepID=A0A6A6E8U2_9PEZI|nr:hypothetical protein K469DRAFT_566858 [Zopfia rhizophila CBS 207.26]
MPMWPFVRRSGRAAKFEKGQSTGVAEGKQPATAYTHESSSNDTVRGTPSRRSSRRKRRSSRSTVSMRDVDKNSPGLQPVDTPFAKEPHSLPRGSAEDITALPYTKRLEQSPHLRPITQEHGIPYNFQTNSHSSLPIARERGKLQRPQSLRSKRTAYDSALPRRKSRKKRKNDHIREEEIRAMSMPLPQKRPAGHSGGLLRRDSKKVKGGLNRHFERPTSNISLPPEDSIHSSMSGASESRAFRVSTFDMFSPRPKIRYSVGSQYYYGTSPPTYPVRAESRKEPRTIPTTRDGKEDKKSKRIDDLADTLDAGALREILERDKRRKEKKRKADEERLHRRLERRAEKQRAAEQSGTPATSRKEAKGVVGLGIEKDISTPMEDVRPSTPHQPQKLNVTGPTSKTTSQLPTPMDSPVGEPVVAGAKAIRYSRANMSPPTSPVHTRAASNISQMPELLSEIVARQTPVESVEPAQDPRASGPLHPVESVDTVDTSKKGSSRRRSSEGRRMGVFASFFRRGKRNSQEQGRTTPSEVSFSNTSRESMARQPPPAHLVAPTAPIQIRRPSGVPHRTMSKFREDLPEFPLSPPDSRVQSPEVTSASPIAARRRSQHPSSIRVDSNSPGTGARTDSPVSPGVPAAGLMSQSLASVDSEGSWLSGKPMKRRSNKSHMRSSVGSSITATAKQQEEFNASYEELGIPDDEYFRRLTPQPDERRRSAHSGDVFTRKPSSTAIAAMGTTAESDDDEERPLPPTAADTAADEENFVQSSVGRQPTIVHRQPRVKSTEGLLSYFQAEKGSLKESHPSNTDESAEQESPMSEGEPVSLQRAKSVDLGKNHVRHLSAGSAKLLDIPAKRSSVDQKRSGSSSHSKLSDVE